MATVSEMNISLEDASWYHLRIDEIVRGPQQGHDLAVIRALLPRLSTVLHLVREAKGLGGSRHNRDWVAGRPDICSLRVATRWTNFVRPGATIRTRAQSMSLARLPLGCFPLCLSVLSRPRISGVSSLRARARAWQSSNNCSLLMRQRHRQRTSISVRFAVAFGLSWAPAEKPGSPCRLTHVAPGGCYDRERPLVNAGR